MTRAIKLVSATKHSIKSLSFDERRVVIGKGVKFFLSARSNKSDENNPNWSTAVVSLEILVCGDSRDSFELEDCIDFSQDISGAVNVNLRDLFGSVSDFEELADVLPATALDSLSKEMEMDIDFDDINMPSKVTFTVAAGLRYMSRVVVDYEKVGPYVTVRRKED